ncbi:MAG TPA: ABC transporter permease [Candidatus Limnocylindrales bacterium]|nr:ABC transporter permease [Candidatus Limnocylindrales bacterium]
MRVAWLIAVKDLRQRLRDRSALLVAVVAPLGLALIFSQLLAGATSFTTTWVVADLDGGALARTLRDEVIGSLEEAGVATVTDAADEAAAIAAVEDGDADVAIVIPAGFTAAIQSGQPTVLPLTGGQDEGLSTQVARAVAQRFGDQVVAVQLSVATVASLRGEPVPPADQARIIGTAAAEAPPIVLVDEEAALRQLTLSTYFSASMAILFLFFSAQIGIISLFEERRQGTLSRILAGPVTPAAILGGKTLSSFLMGVLAMALLVGATTVLIGASWGPPLGVALVCLSGIVAAIGISTLVCSFARTAEAAGAASSAVAITLAVLGGTFSPTAQAPEIMAMLALLTPHGWFMRGLGDMQGAGADATGGLPAAGVLLAMGLVTYGIGIVRARRLVTPG